MPDIDRSTIFRIRLATVAERLLGVKVARRQREFARQRVVADQLQDSSTRSYDQSLSV